jgi:hypothetical protein
VGGNWAAAPTLFQGGPDLCVPRARKVPQADEVPQARRVHASHGRARSQRPPLTWSAGLSFRNVGWSSAEYLVDVVEVGIDTRDQAAGGTHREHVLGANVGLAGVSRNGRDILDAEIARGACAAGSVAGASVGTPSGPATA